MRPYDTIEKSPRNRQLDSEEEKAKNQDLFHTINARDDRCIMNMPMIGVPKEGVSITLDVLYGLHYPRLFLLRCSQLIPVVLRTEDVEQQAYDSMVNAGRLVPVPPGAEGVAESLELLFIKDNSTASLLAPVLFNICDSNNESYDPNNAYDLCLLVFGEGLRRRSNVWHPSLENAVQGRFCCTDQGMERGRCAAICRDGE
jgi:hypothetical protein